MGCFLAFSIATDAPPSWFETALSGPPHYEVVDLKQLE
jgi:hypothetical protein